MILSDDQIKSRVAVGNLIEDFIPEHKQDAPDEPYYGLGKNSYTVRLSNQFLFWNLIKAEPPAVLPANVKPNGPEFARYMQQKQSEANILKPSSKVPEGHLVGQETDEICITPQGHVLAITIEKINVPPNLCAMITTAGEAAFVGIDVATSWLYSPYSNQLTLRIANNGQKMIVLNKGMGIANIVFMDCTPAGIPV